MYIIDQKSGETIEIDISRVVEADFKSITKDRFWFDWKQKKAFELYKLCIKGEDILGLVSLETYLIESRIQIRLLAVSKENRGFNKRYDEIAGNLIAFAGIQSIKKFGEMACISLVPKTELIKHYMNKYSMFPAGKSLFLDDKELINLIVKYDP